MVRLLRTAFQGLLQLAGIEGKEAALVGLRLLIFLAVAPACVPSLATCSFCCSLPSCSPLVFGISWIWISLGLAILHFAVVAFCAFFAKNCPQAGLQATFAGIAEGLRSDEKFKS